MASSLWFFRPRRTACPPTFLYISCQFSTQPRKHLGLDLTRLAVLTLITGSSVEFYQEWLQTVLAGSMSWLSLPPSPPSLSLLSGSRRRAMLRLLYSVCCMDSRQGPSSLWARRWSPKYHPSERLGFETARSSYLSLWAAWLEAQSVEHLFPWMAAISRISRSSAALLWLLARLYIPPRDGFSVDLSWKSYRGIWREIHLSRFGDRHCMR